MSTARTRNADFDFCLELGINRALHLLTWPGSHENGVSRVIECCRRVDVLPACLFDVEGLERPVATHDAQTVRQGAIPMRHGAFKTREEGGLTEKHACIQSVVMVQVF